VSRKALIITDGTKSVETLAQPIKSALSGFSVCVCSADKFTGNDLLAADIFFIGAEKPKPASFSYLEEMFAHINLASRKCAVFSTCEKTLKWLSGIIKDSEASLGDTLLSLDGGYQEADIKKWIKGLL